MDNKLTQAQQSELNDALKRASSFEGMVRSEGYAYIKNYLANKIQAFANGLLLSDKPIESFEAERNEIKGIRKLIVFIDHDIEVLDEERKQQAEREAASATTSE